MFYNFSEFMKLKSWVSNDLGNFLKKILFFNHKSINSNLIFPFFARFPLKS